MTLSLENMGSLVSPSTSPSYACNCLKLSFISTVFTSAFSLGGLLGEGFGLVRWAPAAELGLEGLVAIFRVRVAFKCLACSSLRCKARPATSPQVQGEVYLRNAAFFSNHLTVFFWGGCQVKLSLWVWVGGLGVPYNPIFWSNKTKKKWSTWNIMGK